LLRLLRTEQTRLWLAIGALLGFGLLNKWTIGFLAFGLFVGMLFGPERRLFATPWFAGGVVLALALWAPNLWWQADHGWPQIDMIFDIQEGASDAGATIAWLPLQVVIAGFLLTPLWIGGLVRLLRSPEVRRWRSLGIAYLALAVPIAVAAGDKP
jgi:4-amino-4-deoxy-L-arabinose transferase-like glycosyltransferase